MKQSITIKFILVLIFIITTQTLNAQDSYNLQYNYVTGNNYRYRINASLQSEQIFNDITTPSSSESKLILRLNIADFKKDIYSINVSFDSSYSKTDRGAGGITEDNGEKIRGKKTLYSVDKFGALLGKTFVDSVKGRNIPSYLGTNLVHKFAGKELKIGDTWSTKTADSILTPGSKIKINSTADYKLEGKEKFNGHDCIKVSCLANSAYIGSINAIANVNGTEISMTIDVDGKAKTTGTIYFDYTRGIIVSCENIIKADETISTDSGVIPMSHNYKSSINILE